MSYSRVPFPPGIRNVRLRREPLGAYYGDTLACAERGGTWFVWDRATRVVLGLFRMAPNGHGWWPAEAHAKSMVNCADPVDIAALDSIP